MVKIELEINNCRECLYSTNSSIEHNCPFTSEPHPATWWCTHPGNKGINKNFTIRDEYKIDPRCPEKEK